MFHLLCAHIISSLERSGLSMTNSHLRNNKTSIELNPIQQFILPANGTWGSSARQCRLRGWCLLQARRIALTVSDEITRWNILLIKMKYAWFYDTFMCSWFMRLRSIVIFISVNQNDGFHFRNNGIHTKHLASCRFAMHGTASLQLVPLSRPPLTFDSYSDSTSFSTLASHGIVCNTLQSSFTRRKMLSNSWKCNFSAEERK